MRTRGRAMQIAAAITLSMVSGAAYPTACAAEQTPPAASDENIIVTKDLTGKISAVAPGFLNVIYKSEAERTVDYEMPLRVDEQTEFQFKRGLNEFAFGDTVKVEYAEAQQPAERTTADGKTESYMRIVSRTAKVVTFLKPATKGLVSDE